MTGPGQRWAIILAAGEGSRLREFAVDATGAAVPKQYCALRGRESLLALALARSRRVVAGERIIPVVAEGHRRWWQPELAALEAAQIVVQPCNRGTAIGLLLPLLHILARDREAVVVLLPADHFVTHEEVLAAAVERAFAAVGAAPDRLVLLGMRPERADSDLGWILPVAGGPGREPRAVASFVEKPSRATAASLMARGGLVNALVLVGRGATFLELYRGHAGLVAGLRAALASEARDATLAALYERLASLDLSRDLLERSAPRLAVLAVPACGWSDLGTPGRVRDCLRRHPAPRTPREAGCASVDLARIATGWPAAKGAPGSERLRVERGAAAARRRSLADLPTATTEEELTHYTEML